MHKLSSLTTITVTLIPVHRSECILTSRPVFDITLLSKNQISGYLRHSI